MGGLLLNQNPASTNQPPPKAMIVDLMHACDVAEALAADPPASASGWQWSRQLRYYREEVGGTWLAPLPALFLHRQMLLAIYLAVCLAATRLARLLRLSSPHAF